MLSLVQFCYGYAGPNLPRMEDWGLLKLRLVTSPVENYLPLRRQNVDTGVSSPPRFSRALFSPTTNAYFCSPNLEQGVRARHH